MQHTLSVLGGRCPHLLLDAPEFIVQTLPPLSAVLSLKSFIGCNTSYVAISPDSSALELGRLSGNSWKPILIPRDL